MDVNKDFERPHVVYITIGFEKHGVTRIPSDKIISALRMLGVCEDIVIRAADIESGDVIYKHEGAGVSEWM